MVDVLIIIALLNVIVAVVITANFVKFTNKSESLSKWMRHNDPMNIEFYTFRVFYFFFWYFTWPPAMAYKAYKAYLRNKVKQTNHTN